MKRYIRSNDSASATGYDNAVHIVDNAMMGYSRRTKDRIIELLDEFAEVMNSDPDIQSFEIIAKEHDVKIHFEQVNGYIMDAWSFSYTSLKSHNDVNLLWLQHGLDRLKA